MLSVAIADPMTGEELTRPVQYDNAEVEIPFNGPRLAAVTLPMQNIYSENDVGLPFIEPMRYALKIRHLRRLVFYGPILEPEWNFGDGKVTVNAHDPTIYLMHHYLRATDVAVTEEHAANGAAAWAIVQAARLTAAEDAAGYRGPGIARGPDYTGATARMRKAKHGVEVWSDLTEFTSQSLAPDFDFQPIDDQFDPDARWTPGVMCQFRTWDERVRDRVDAVRFSHGFGSDNCSNVIYRPSGSAMRNRFMAVRNADDENPGDAAAAKEPEETRAFVARHVPSLRNRGIMEGRETPTGRNTPELLRLYARGMVRAYGLPPGYFDIELREEAGRYGSQAGTPFRYGESYVEGDRIGVHAKRGPVSVDLTGKVMKVTLSQVRGGYCRAGLEVIPQVIADGDVLDTGGVM